MKIFFGMMAITAAFSLPAAAQEYADLSYKFQAGQQFALTQESRSETYTTVNDITQRVTRDFNNTISIDVTEAQPGRTVLSFRYKELKFNFNSRNQNIYVDAKTPNDKEPFQAALLKILDHPFTVELQNTGAINKVNGLDNLLDSASTTFASLKKDEQEAYKKLMKDQFGTDAFRAWLEQLLVIYPAHGVKTGTQWEESVPLRTGLIGRMDLYWSLQTWDNQTAKISTTGKVKTNKLEMLTLEDGIQATAEIEGTMQSNNLIDRNSGFPSICIQNLEMTGEYTYKANKAKKLKTDLKVPVKTITNASYKIKQMK
ncbi:hypothetical protein F0L74_01770 [Chitinophaga agrisoli]|uniref:DUF4412 domain-containing protein n=1 Tax=Chitinophaga agrisoli TaxID=2607653 RepID=A0A5B2W2K2_9BACT|nr:DUF6263 family protein [Chitinophaga agrisoli]KAA2244727.1 hypothetical protein F0L74_01770 [Chitinophaga agrisoli]